MNYFGEIFASVVLAFATFPQSRMLLPAGAKEIHIARYGCDVLSMSSILFSFSMCLLCMDVGWFFHYVLLVHDVVHFPEHRRGYA